MTPPIIDLVVTRHPALVKYLLESGLVHASTPVIERASRSDVLGKHVLGKLPTHLASAAATVTEIPMRWSEADRAAMQLGDLDLDLDATRRAAGKPVTYTVADRWHPAESFAVTRELSPLDDRDEALVGGDRRASGSYYIDPMSLRGDVSFHISDYSYYRDGGSWTLFGTMLLDAEAWAQGRVKVGRKPLSFAGTEPVPVNVAIIAAVEWLGLAPFMAGSEDADGRPVAIMQVEPLAIIDGKRFRIRWNAVQSVGRDLDRCLRGLEFHPVEGDDQCQEFRIGEDADNKRLPQLKALAEGGGTPGERKAAKQAMGKKILARCFNEASLIPVVERALAKRGVGSDVLDLASASIDELLREIRMSSAAAEVQLSHDGDRASLARDLAALLRSYNERDVRLRGVIRDIRSRN